jgi:hypothetical protein
MHSDIAGTGAFDAVLPDTLRSGKKRMTLRPAALLFIGLDSK